MRNCVNGQWIKIRCLVFLKDICCCPGIEIFVLTAFPAPSLQPSVSQLSLPTVFLLTSPTVLKERRFASVHVVGQRRNFTAVRFVCCEALAILFSSRT